MKKLIAAIDRLPITSPLRRWFWVHGHPNLPDRKLTDAEAWEILQAMLEKREHRLKNERTRNGD
tara:strand:- start:503 stop:694 length:192 start_codon:yes stop_codon:yes gene_type:complete